MTVTFCGHAQFSESEEYEQRILAFLEEKIGNQPADLLLGGYGSFDSFAYYCCKKFKETHPKVMLILVTPYPTSEYQKSPPNREKTAYDFIIYPGIEDKPKRFAIVYRNQYMVKKADYVVAYVSHRWGGAYTTYKYAQRKGKEIFNLANFMVTN